MTFYFFAREWCNRPWHAPCKLTPNFKRISSVSALDYSCTQIFMIMKTDFFKFKQEKFCCSLKAARGLKLPSKGKVWSWKAKTVRIGNQKSTATELKRLAEQTQNIQRNMFEVVSVVVSHQKPQCERHHFHTFGINLLVFTCLRYLAVSAPT